jgi:hypothetical protein
MNVSSSKTTLQVTPEVLKAIYMAIAVHILARAVTNGVVLVANLRKIIIGFKFIGVNCRARLNASFNDRLKRSAFHIRNHVRHHTRRR